MTDGEFTTFYKVIKLRAYCVTPLLDKIADIALRSAKDQIINQVDWPVLQVERAIDSTQETVRHMRSVLDQF